MRAEERNAERIALLDKYLEDRSSIRQAIYKQIEWAARLGLSSNEIKSLSDLLSKFEGESWSVKHELDELRGRK